MVYVKFPENMWEYEIGPQDMDLILQECRIFLFAEQYYVSLWLNWVPRCSTKECGITSICSTFAVLTCSYLRLQQRLQQFIPIESFNPRLQTGA